MRIIIAAILGLCCSSGVTAAQSIVGPEKVRLMATAVKMSGHDCEGMVGQYLGEADDSKIYIVECRGGDRFVYMEMPGGQVGVTPCAVMRAKGYPCQSRSETISDIDIWRCADIMIKRYGDTADFEACRRADEFNAKGDRAGMRIWLRILAAIDRLQRVQRGEMRQ